MNSGKLTVKIINLNRHIYSSKPSGGTLNTVFTLMDVYPLKQIGASSAPYAISPIPGPKTRNTKSWVTSLFGIRVVPDLGILTTSLGGMVDKPIVQRSWGLLGGEKFYGPNFHFSEYMKARSYLMAVVIHFGLALGGLCLIVPLFRKFARRYVYQPGDGPTKEESKNDRYVYSLRTYFLLDEVSGVMRRRLTSNVNSICFDS
jgi:hypothetical protein